MARTLRYVLVETGACTHCGKDAGDHSIEGLCWPSDTLHGEGYRGLRPCYRGTESYAFVDLDSAEVRALGRVA